MQKIINNDWLSSSMPYTLDNAIEFCNSSIQKAISSEEFYDTNKLICWYHKFSS